MKKQYLRSNVIVGLFFATIFGLSLHSCVTEREVSIKGNEKIVIQEIKIDEYDKIVLDVPGEVHYEQSNTTACTVETDSNLLEYLDVSVKNKTLIIKEKHDNRSLRLTKLIIRTSSSTLHAAKIIGSGNIYVTSSLQTTDLSTRITGSGGIVFEDSLFCEQFAIEISGSGGVVTQKNMQTNNLAISINGSGSIVLKGNVQDGHIEINGSGTLQARNCTFNALRGEINGSGEIKATVNDLLSGEITGSGNITYYGRPVISALDINGSGKLRQGQ